MKRSNHKWKIIYHYFSRISILQLKMKQDIFPSKLLYYQNYHDQETKQDLQLHSIGWKWKFIPTKTKHNELDGMNEALYHRIRWFAGSL